MDSETASSQEVASQSGQTEAEAKFEHEDFKLYLPGDPVPDLAVLRRQFPGSDNVSGIFDGRRPFIQHPARSGMGRQPGDRIFRVRVFGLEIDLEDAVKEMLGSGWCPANERGAYFFIANNWDYFDDRSIVPRRPNWVLAPGSHAIAAGNELITALSFGSGWRSLGSRLRANPASPRMGILFEKAA